MINFRVSRLIVSNRVFDVISLGGSHAFFVRLPFRATPSTQISGEDKVVTPKMSNDIIIFRISPSSLPRNVVSRSVGEYSFRVMIKL
jgi:hypothetical protein